MAAGWIIFLTPILLVLLLIMGAVVVGGVQGVANAAETAPAYDSPRDIRTAERITKRAFYRISYSNQRTICRLFDTRTVYVVRKLGRSAYRNTPARVSLREAQKGVIYALTDVC